MTARGPVHLSDTRGGRAKLQAPRAYLEDRPADRDFARRQADRFVSVDHLVTTASLRPPAAAPSIARCITRDLHREVAPARTFTFLKDVEMLQNGFAPGGSLDNAIVLGETGIKQCAAVRRRVRAPQDLDAVGDLPGRLSRSVNGRAPRDTRCTPSLRRDSRRNHAWRISAGRRPCAPMECPKNAAPGRRRRGPAFAGPCVNRTFTVHSRRLPSEAVATVNS